MNAVKCKKDDKKKKIKTGTVVSNNIYLFRLALRYAPGLVALYVLEGVLTGFKNAVGIYYTKVLYDRLENGSTFTNAVEAIAFMAIFLLSFGIFYYWFWNIQRGVEKRILQYQLHSALFEKARSLDLACYDNPKFYNDFIWSINESDARVDKQLYDIGKFVNRVVASVIITGILVNIHPILAAIILFFSVFRVVFQSILAKIDYRRSLEFVPLDRKTEYVNRMFRLADCAKEIRLSHVGENLISEYEKTIEEKKNLIRKYARKRYFLATFTFIMMHIGDLSVMLFLLYELLVNKSITLGDFAAGVTAIWELSRFLRDIMNYIVKSKEHALYVDKLRTFLKYDPKIVGGSLLPEHFESLEVRNVRFAYLDDEVLRNVNFTINRGDKIAIVGYNGAGKTTLIKLLMRLYDTTEGEILYNGKNIKEYDLDAYRAHIGAVFQDYRIFAASIAENVLADEYQESQQQTVLDALEKSTFAGRLSSLENGINTELTREFYNDGVNLSGGEAQKIAIARVFAHPYDLIIMDEPSSALDPISEYNLNRSILDSAEDKTVIFISHRLSTTRHADKIYMFEKGEIVESGTHEELMEKNGKYAYMFNLQAEKYLSGAE